MSRSKWLTSISLSIVIRLLLCPVKAIVFELVAFMFLGVAGGLLHPD